MKKNFSALPAECGEKKIFTATSRMRLKKIFHRYQQNAVKKNFSPLKFQTLQILTANINAYLKFTSNIIKLSERWRSGIRRQWHAGGQRFEPVYGCYFFVRNPVNAVKKNFSPLKTANLTKIHRLKPQILQKTTAFNAFNAKRCGRFAVKKVFFHRYSPLILHYFLTKPRPGKAAHSFVG